MTAFPRIAATFVVLLVIGIISLAAIEAVNTVGPVLAHGQNVEHENGKILTITQNGVDMYFTLQVKGQPTMQFRCTGRCLTSLSHMQRHLAEKAPTDVYYIQQPSDGALVAIDVD